MHCGYDDKGLTCSRATPTVYCMDDLHEMGSLPQERANVSLAVTVLAEVIERGARTNTPWVVTAEAMMDGILAFTVNGVHFQAIVKPTEITP